MKQKPYTDMPKFVEIINFLDMGRILQINEACSNVIDHITFGIRKKLCLDLLHNKRKICIIVDELTTLSQKSMLVIFVRSTGTLGTLCLKSTKNCQKKGCPEK